LTEILQLFKKLDNIDNILLELEVMTDYNKLRKKKQYDLS